MTDEHGSLIPSEDDIKKMFAEIPNLPLASIPTTLFQIMVARMMLKAIDKMKDNLAKSISELEKNIDRMLDK